MTLVEFLRECLDADEAVAKRDPDAWRRLCMTAYENLTSDTTVTMGEVDAILTWTMPDPIHVLAEIAAKRAVVDLQYKYAAKIDGEWACCHDPEDIEAGRCPEFQTAADLPVLRALAQPYAGRDGWDEAWRAEA